MEWNGIREKKTWKKHDINLIQKLTQRQRDKKWERNWNKKPAEQVIISHRPSQRATIMSHNCILLTRSTKFHVALHVSFDPFNTHIPNPSCIAVENWEHAESLCINHAIALAWESIHLCDRVLVPCYIFSRAHIFPSSTYLKSEYVRFFLHISISLQCISSVVCVCTGCIILILCQQAKNIQNFPT